MLKPHFPFLISYFINTHRSGLTKSNRSLVILILGLLSAIGPFSIDMYLPGFPAIALDLHTSVDQVSYSLSSFFLGICLGQLLCGPLLDRFGRKIPLYVGLVLYLGSSIGCAFASSVEALIILRFLQALGGCVGMVAPRAIIRDLFPENETAKIFSLMILILGISPIIAPTAGSYIIANWGWHAVFVTLAIITALIFVSVILWLPESKKPDPTFSLKPASILESFTGVIKNRQFFIYSMTGAISSAGLFAYLAGSPFVFMQYFKTTDQQYGYIFAAIAAGLIAGSQLNNLLLKQYSSAQIIRATLILQTLIGILLCVLTYFQSAGLLGTIVLIFLFLSCQGFSFPNSAALSMAPFSREAGSASALMGALQMGAGALAAAVIGLLEAHDPLPLALVMAACATIALVILLIGKQQPAIEVTAGNVQEQEVVMLEEM